MIRWVASLWAVGALAGHALAEDAALAPANARVSPLVRADAPSAAQATDSQLRAQVLALLTAGVEPGGAHERIAVLGEPGERALRGVFEDQSVPRFVRLRALAVLASFKTAATAHYFEALVQAARTVDARPATGEPKQTAALGDLHPARSALVLRRALDVLRELAPLLGPKPDTEAVTACLSHPDAHVRKAAAALLATLGGPAQIDRALAERLTHERSRMVRTSVEHALTSRSARSTDPR